MEPGDLRSKRILISPLNWGMGHVSRCLALVHQLQQEDNTIVVACDAFQRNIFSQYFDNLMYIEHEGYPFNFRGKGRFALDLLLVYPELMKRMNRERKEVERYVADYFIDVVISDHRYGFYSATVPSVFLTHQINVPVPWYGKGVNRTHRELVKAFDSIWVPDAEGGKYSGKLSQNADKRVHYIGVLSRFSLYHTIPLKKSGTVLIASGPAIYAQQLIDEVVRRKETGLTVIHSKGLRVPSEVRAVSENWKLQDEIIMSAGKVISRSGYSTIMDLVYLNTTFELIPTPGQQEQVYLAEFNGPNE